MPHYRDLAFTIIALLSLAILDGSEVIVRKIGKTSLKLISYSIFATCFFLALCTATWAANSREANLDDVQLLLIVLYISFAATLLQRLVMIFGEPNAG